MNEEQLAVLPEQVRSWDEAKNSDTPEIFWDRLTNMRSKIGTGLYKPGEDAGKEDVAAFLNKAVELSNGKLLPRPSDDDEESMSALYSAMGRPADAEGYEFAELDGNKIGDDYKKFVSELGFKLNLTKSQLKNLDETFRTRDLNVANEASNKFKDDLSTLNQEWGFAYDQRVHMAKKVASTFFPHLDPDTDFSASELRSFHSIAKQFASGGKEFASHDSEQGNMMTPLDASAKIAEMRNNKDHPYNNPRAPGHDDAKKKMRELYKIKNNLPV